MTETYLLGRMGKQHAGDDSQYIGKEEGHQRPNTQAEPNIYILWLRERPISLPDKKRMRMMLSDLN